LSTQAPAFTFEHKVKETSEKSGETAPPGKTGKGVVTDASFGKTSLEVRAERRQDYRKKR
jgi:hypothetical protein